MDELLHSLPITEGEQDDGFAEWPQTIQYLCHPCLLILSHKETEGFELCKTCGKGIEGYHYRCDPCDFSLHTECSLLPSRMESEGKQLFHHFTHNHPLILTEIKDDDVYDCFACEESCCAGQPYIICCVDECSFSLHDSCFNLPQGIHRPFHHHPLTLVSPESSWAPWSKYCDGCLSDSRGFGFQCEECKFIVDIKCAFLRSTIDEGQDEILHFSHIHPLTMTKNKHDDDDNVYCKICGECSLGILYGCVPCGYYLHQSCTEFPQTLQHFDHPCLLTLGYNKVNPNQFNSCTVCDDHSFKGSSYNCKACNYKIQIDCALLPSKMESQGLQQFHHFSHGHPLTLAEREHDDEIKCSGCLKYCSGQTYICYKENCKFSLHDSCFNLPRKINHPFHSTHPLTLTLSKYTWHKTCYVCFHYCNGFTYSCSDCKFFLDVECPVAISTINYQGHNHNILFIEGSLSFFKKCRACGTGSKSSAHIFRCLECDFCLHFECGPLPLTIQHESHMDPLTLTDSPAVIDGEHKLDTDVFYCDACEEERDPRLPVYYCSDGCAYLAEMECVKSEVTRSLKGECGQVELRSPIRHIAGKVISKGIVKGIALDEAAGEDRETSSDKEVATVKIKPSMTFNSIVCSLTEEERDEWSRICYAAERDWDRSWTIETLLSLSNEACDDFRKFLNDSNRETKDNWRSEIVSSVGDHLVPWSLAPIFKDLCAKHGDISAESTVRSSKVKMCFIIQFCGTIDSMYSKRILDISDNLLFSWWVSLKTLQFAGFHIQFAFDRLKRVVDACHGLRLKRKLKHDLRKIDKEITVVSQEIENLKAKLEALKQKRESTIEFTNISSKSRKDSECLKEASLLKWMIAGDGLL